jgi:hypothetical protein
MTTEIVPKEELKLRSWLEGVLAMFRKQTTGIQGRHHHDNIMVKLLPEPLSEVHMNAPLPNGRMFATS